MSDAPLDLMRKLSPAAQAEVMRRREAALSLKRRIWYCHRGRICNGQPHEGVPYKHARSDQWPPDGGWWDVWFLMSGRGTGKTWSGSNWCRKISNQVSRIALIGRTWTDLRQTMVEGETGLIAACEAAGETYDWKPALKEFTFQNGAKAFGWTAEEPKKLRGPQHGAGWLDEPCHMEFIDDVWDNYNFGLRLKGLPGGAKTLLTSTPLPNKWTKARIAETGTVLVRVSTSVNLENLDDGYIRRVIDPLRGTRTGRQELEAEILEDVEGALWSSDLFEYIDGDAFRAYERIVVGVDPAGSRARHSDETGIIVAAKMDDALFVLDDFTGKYSPAGWAAQVQKAVALYGADAVVVERNFGGDMVKDTLVNHGYAGRVVEAKASRGKQVRAEPISAMYEQHRAFHVRGKLTELEDELTTWVPGDKVSPNRLDALVWAASNLMKVGSGEVQTGVPHGSMRPASHAIGSKWYVKNALARVGRPR